jgi:hypothetical protein
MSFAGNHPAPRMTAGGNVVVATFLIGPRNKLPHPAPRTARDRRPVNPSWLRSLHIEMR